MNVAQHFARNASRAGELPAIAWGARTVATHATLAGRAAAIAGSLRDELRLAPGDRVAIAAPNRPDYVELIGACWWAGLAVVPVNVKLHPGEIAWILEHSEARAAFVAESVASALPEIAGLERVVVIGSADAQRLAQGERMPVAEASPGDLAWLFYTSGTTGRPKGAMITHGNLLAMTAAFLADIEPIACGDAILHAAPLSHGSGLYLLPHAARAACQVVPESGGFDEAEVVATLASWPGTRMFAAPTIVRRLARHVAERGAEVANLAALIYGGAPMYLADLDAAHAALGFRLAQIYGQGESPMTITALDRRLHADRSHPRWRERLASVGTAQLGMEVRIADPDGAALATGEIGEVLARGPAVVPGYWRDPEATARTMSGGWLHTGDVGCLDADGFLYLKDRSKDVVISGGMNIYPREVEEALLTHPGVREIAVLGLPDPEWGERVVACMVATPGTAPAELDAWCLARLARFKRPRAYHFVETLPKNAYGKVLKRELRARLVGPGGAP